jgi:hypothetical protein
MAKDGIKPITEDESKKYIDSKMAQIIYEKINSFEKALTGNMNSKSKIPSQPLKYKDNMTPEEAFRHELTENLANLVTKYRSEDKINPFTAEAYLEDGHAHIKRLIGTTLDFSGNKEELAAKMNNLRQQVKESTGVAEEKPKGQEKQTKVTKVSSEETWNAITDKVTVAAGIKIDEVVTENDKNGSFRALILKDALKTTFADAINQYKLESKEAGHEIDQKTVELFKQNGNKLVDHIFLQTQKITGVAVTDTETVISTKNSEVLENLKNELTMFNSESTVAVKNKTTGWKKVADFCKSIKMDKLAEFCHDKHVESLAKSVTTKLNKNLEKAEKIDLNSSKPKSTKHNYNYGQGM